MEWCARTLCCLRRLIRMACLMAAASPVFAQQTTLLLLNPSFEDEPAHSKPPQGWFVCGPPGESPSDIHPTGYFQVAHPAADGETYVGLVVRDNGTWEALGQRLEQALLGGHCYRFSLKAARSPQYRSVSRLSGEPVQYVDPVRIRLWAGRFNCDRAELLAASEPVVDTDWRELLFRLQPAQDYQYLLIEAYYASDSMAVSRGNVLIDQSSPLIPVNCQSFDPLESCPRLSFSLPSNPEELRRQVSALIPELNFANGTAQIRNSYFCLDTQSEPIQENKALFKLARFLQGFPERQLVIAVKGPGKHMIEDRVLELSRRLLALGLDPKRFRVHPFRKKDRQMDWLGQNREGDLFVRVI